MLFLSDRIYPASLKLCRGTQDLHYLFLSFLMKVVIHEDSEGGYWAEVPAMPGCATQGDTFDELLKNIYEAVEGCLSVDVETLCVLCASNERLVGS